MRALITAFLLLATLTVTCVGKFNWTSTKYVYAFGDSYTFVEGTRGLATFSFIGDRFHFEFTPEELLSNEIVPKNTSSDGANWIEYLTRCFEGRPSQCLSHQLWDFAFGGADIDASILPLHHNFTIDLVDEVNQWATYASHVVPHPEDATLTAWWIGINDTGDSLRNSTITDWTAFWRTEMTSYFNAVELAYSKGLKGTYLFINVPPEHRNPSRNGDSAGQTLLQAHIEQYNNILSDFVAALKDRHSDLNILTFDSYTWFNQILDDGAFYGFTNTTGFCECSDPTFFWYNSGHPTARVHQLLAQAIEGMLLQAST
ncbi:hypothetical protein BDY19DRAFT_226732 [Irpex rosettiformis]|uniref:Uncharacterized protein n=1 Tax=Irpex rosettiformis TaxID=378272 RepID=A0ACB8U0H4_9APHY|nr:hypothetical protein BDY19DRAFT_226732 [Irpex rosettiformis]